MSWSINKTGKASEVAEQLVEELAKNPCQEPEETIRQEVGAVCATALAAMPEDQMVEVVAFGSQSPVYPEGGGDATGEFKNEVKLSLKPIYT